MTRFIIGVALVGVALAACAPVTAPDADYSTNAGRQCFTPAQLHNFRGTDDGPIYVRARVSEVFELTTAGCPGVVFANSLNIQPDGPSDQLCVGQTARLRPDGPGATPVVCAARLTRKLTPEQVAALPDRSQP